MFRAIFAEVNRVYNLNPWQLAFWHASVAVAVLLPFTPFMDWPADPNFYLAAVLVALILAVGVVIQLNLSAEKKGRVSSIAIPVEAVSAFVIWLLVKDYMAGYYMAHPAMTAGVAGAFVLSSAALYFLRTTDISWSSFLVVAPVGVTYAVAGVVTKLVVPPAVLVPAALSFVLINFVVMAVVMGLFLLIKGKADPGMYAKPMLKAGALTGVFSAVSYLTFVVSVVFAPNPGYTSILAALVPVWLMWYHELRLIEDRAKPLAGLLIVASIILLIVSNWAGA